MDRPPNTTLLVRPYGRDVRWSPNEMAVVPYEVATMGEAKRLADELTAEHGKTWVAVQWRGRLSKIIHHGREEPDGG